MADTLQRQDLVNELRKREDYARQQRSKWNARWEDVVKYVMPEEGFVWKEFADPKDANVIDDTASDALDTLASTLYSFMFSPNSYEIKPRGREEDAPADLLEWSQLATELYRMALMHPKAGFTSTEYNCLRSFIGFGVAPGRVGEIPGQHLLFQNISLGRCLVAENGQGTIDTVFIRTKMSADQMADEYGKDSLSLSARTHLVNNPYEPRFEVLQVVIPRKDRGPRLALSTEMPWADYVIDMSSGGGHMMREGGHRFFPYPTARWQKIDGNPYAWSLVMRAIRSVKRLNKMMVSNLKAGNRMVEPAIALPGGLFKHGVSRTPNSVNYYDPSELGNLPGGRMDILNVGMPENLPVGVDMEDRAREAVRSGLKFYQALLPNSPQMTATEFLGRKQELVQVIGPPLSRYESERAQPVGDAALRILSDAFALPVMPNGYTIDDVQVAFQSPLQLARKAEGGLATMRTIEALAGIAALDETAADVLDGTAAARSIHDAFGAPEEIFHSEAEVMNRRQARAQRQQMVEQAQTMTAGAQVAQEVGKARQLLGNEV